MLPIGGAILSSGDDDDGSSSGGSSTPALPSPSVVYMWVRTGYSGGGLSGLHASCTTSSTTQTFSTTVSNHRAFSPTSSYNPANLFANDPPIQRPNGTLIISSYSDFFDPAETLDASINTGTDVYHTGLDSNGDLTANNCLDWTSNIGTDPVNSGQTNRTGTGRFNQFTLNCGVGDFLCISW